VLLSYRLPREPSTPRINLWRKLKRLGVAQLSDGLVALPADSRTREQLEWLAEDVVAAGGTAGVWLARPATIAQEQDLARSMEQARATEYQELLAEAAAAGELTPTERSRVADRIRAELRRITKRDYFPPPERDQVHAALESLTADPAAEMSPDGQPR
jgi:hypothetical protein